MGFARASPWCGSPGGRSSSASRSRGSCRAASRARGFAANWAATPPASFAKASLLGAISSSCSYAASAMARALFARGASWTNSVVFMVASTNLVIELGVVLYLILGWRFLVAQLVGGVVMIVLLGLLTRVVFRSSRVERCASACSARRRRAIHAEPHDRGARALRDRETLVAAARYTMGDLTMIRVELVAGFLVAGFFSAHVPAIVVASPLRERTRHVDGARERCCSRRSSPCWRASAQSATSRSRPRSGGTASPSAA